MFPILDAVVTQVAQHSTLMGQAWYVLTFVVRMFISLTIANAVYKDESSAYACNVEESSCKLACFDQQYPIHMMRYWNFMLICLAVPTVGFHVYVSFVTDKVKKIENQKTKENDPTVMTADEFCPNKSAYQRQRREKAVGRYKMKTVIRQGEEKEVLSTKKIFYFHLSTLVARLVIEFYFIYLGGQLLHFENDFKKDNFSLSSYFNGYSPSIFRCGATLNKRRMQLSCAANFARADDSQLDYKSVECFVPRQKEKGHIIRLMSCLAVASIVFTLVEIVAIIMRARRHQLDGRTPTGAPEDLLEQAETQFLNETPIPLLSNNSLMHDMIPFPSDEAFSDDEETSAANKKRLEADSYDLPPPHDTFSKSRLVVRPS